jgi:hypothetical protein
VSSLKRLYEMRLQKGCLLQPPFCSRSTSLAQVVLKHGLDHPYTSAAPLTGERDFAPGAVGDEANTSREFIYHLTSLERLLRNIENPGWTFFPSGYPSMSHDPRLLFDYLLDEYKQINSRLPTGDYSADGWLPLARYAKGFLGTTAYRNFTWWTGLNLGPKTAAHLVCKAHKLGMTNAAIPSLAIILCCPVNFVTGSGVVRVPNLLDGFVRKVFSPADYRAQTRPLSGRTINLDGVLSLTHGAEEFAVKSINVSEIDFFPISIDRWMRQRHIVRDDGRLRQLLWDYYKAL